MKKRLCVILSILLLVTLFSGCGGSSAYKSESNYAAKADFAPASSAAGDAGWYYEESANTPMAEPKPADTGSSLPANTKLIYRANIDMESTEFDAAMQGLDELVGRLGG